MAAARMMSETNMKSVLDEMFEKKEWELYGNIASANVDQKLALEDFFKELRVAKDLIVKKYEATCERQKLHYVMELGKVHTIVTKEVLYWKKVIQRRMHKTPRQSCPYRIDFSYRLSEEIFSCIKDLLTCVSQYGLEIHQTKGTTTIKIWSKRKLELFFNDVLGAACGGLPTKVIKNATVKILISEQKVFTLKYTRACERMEITCFYGVWNEHHVPQHL